MAMLHCLRFVLHQARQATFGQSGAALPKIFVAWLAIDIMDIDNGLSQIYQ
jgi:hypothetical protein